MGTRFTMQMRRHLNIQISACRIEAVMNSVKVKVCGRRVKKKHIAHCLSIRSRRLSCRSKKFRESVPGSIIIKVRDRMWRKCTLYGVHSPCCENKHHNRSRNNAERKRLCRPLNLLTNGRFLFFSIHQVAGHDLLAELDSDRMVIEINQYFILRARCLQCVEVFNAVRLRPFNGHNLMSLMNYY